MAACFESFLSIAHADDLIALSQLSILANAIAACVAWSIIMTEQMVYDIDNCLASEIETCGVRSSEHQVITGFTSKTVIVMPYSFVISMDWTRFPVGFK